MKFKERRAIAAALAVLREADIDVALHRMYGTDGDGLFISLLHVREDVQQTKAAVMAKLDKSIEL